MLDVIAEDIAVRREADENEHRAHVEASRTPILHIAQGGIFDPLVTTDLIHDRIPDNLGVRLGKEALLDDLLRAQLVTPVDDVQLASVLCQVGAFLNGGVATADDGDVLALEERAVAHGAVRNTAGAQALLARYAQLPGVATGGHDHRGRAIGAFLADNDVLVALRVDFEREVGDDLGPEFAGVFLELGSQVRAGDTQEAGVILDNIGVEDFAPGDTFFQDACLQLGSSAVHAGAEAGRPGADDEQVVIECVHSAVPPYIGAQHAAPTKQLKYATPAQPFAVAAATHPSRPVVSSA